MFDIFSTLIVYINSQLNVIRVLYIEILADSVMTPLYLEAVHLEAVRCLEGQGK